MNRFQIKCSASSSNSCLSNREGRRSIATARSWTLVLIPFEIAELAVALEEGLGIREFPMQAWADAESLRTDAKFTVGSVIDTCSSLLAGLDSEGLREREDANLV